LESGILAKAKEDMLKYQQRPRIRKRRNEKPPPISDISCFEKYFSIVKTSQGIE